LKSIWNHSDFLPSLPAEYRLERGEGYTPLIRSRSIGAKLGIPELYFKLENLNPTGSYKDRFAAMFVALLKSRQQQFCLSTSSGNTGAALAAYCAAAGITCVLAIVDGAPLPKIKQMQLYGAHTYMIAGFGRDSGITAGVFAVLENISRSMQLPLPISAYRYCAEGMQGVQTMAYEILEEKDADHIFCPAGGGGLTLAIAKGCSVYGARHPAIRLPRVHCVQPEGNDTIAGALRYHLPGARKIASSDTAISGLQVPDILDGNEVVTACHSSGGNGYIVKDQDVFDWQKMLALQEGIFCEPAAAVSVAGLADASRRGEVSKGEKVVCLITGSGFKDMQTVDKNFQLPELPRIDQAALDGIVRQLQTK